MATVPESEFIIQLFVATWNAGNARPEGLEELIPHAGGDYDVLAIGMQESTYVVTDHQGLTSGNIIVNTLTHEDSFEEMLNKIMEIVGDNYTLVSY